MPGTRAIREIPVHMVGESREGGVSPMGKLLCPSCGAPQCDAQKVRFLFDTITGAIADLMARKLDQLICPVCNKPTGIRPALLVISEDRDHLWLVAGNVWSKAELNKRRKQLRSTFNQTPQLIVDCDVLRAHVTTLLHQRLLRIKTLFSVDDVNSYILDNWRDYTPAVFSAYILALANIVPGIGLASFKGAHEDPPSLADLLIKGADFQSQVWKSLSIYWMLDDPKPDGFSFEEDLLRYIDPSYLIKGARRRFDLFAESLVNPPGIPAGGAFVLEAVRASLYAIGDEENPAAEEWAEIFFGMELCLAAKSESEKKVLAIGNERAARTITYRGAYDAVARRLQELFDQHERAIHERIADSERLRIVTAKAGFPQLVEEVLARSTTLQAKGRTLEQISAMWIQVFDSLPSDLAREHLPDWWAKLLMREGRVDDLQALADLVLQKKGDDPAGQAKVEAWLGRYLKQMRQPRRFLDRIGTEARPWELELPPDVLVDLWVERSNALRLTGQTREALRVTEAALPFVDQKSSNAQKLRHNIAILRRDTGAPDVALHELISLLGEVPSGSEEHFYLLDSLIVTYSVLGQFGDALSLAEQALALATGSLADQHSKLNTTRASLLVALGRRAEAAQILMAIDEPSDDPRVAIGEASAWVGIFAEEPDLLPNNRLDRVVQTLAQAVTRAQATGDTQVYLNGLYLGALFTQYSGNNSAVDLWLGLYEAHDQRGVPHRPEMLFWLAWHAYGRGEPDIGHDYLTQVPRSLGAQLGEVQDLALALESPRGLEDALDQAKQMVLFNPAAGATFRDVRLLAELSRDVVGRARRQATLEGGAELGQNGLTDETLRVFAPTAGHVAVIEWIGAGQHQGRFVTVIAANGDVASHWLTLPDVDEAHVLNQLRSRLMNWRLNKKGDPFDLPDWQLLREWLGSQLDPHLVDGDHLVFIEGAETAGLPWHVAAAPRWTSSYSASWGTLLALRQRQVLQPRTFGVFAVPLFCDGKSVTNAFTQSVQNMRNLALELGCEVVAAEGPAADREAFATIMARSDIVKVMCHGFAQKGELSLVVAEDGALPPSDRVALASEQGRRYRLTWRHLQEVRDTPSIVFSAACSSGLATVAGLGERLGLFNALSVNGTRALVAPWWDIPAEPVLSIADDAFERYARGDGLLAVVIRDACRDATESLPCWLAWALALEGDWR